MKNQKFPKPAYAGIVVTDNGFYIAIKNNRTITVKCAKNGLPNKEKTVLNWLSEYAREHNAKFIAAGVTGKVKFDKLASRLWLKQDIVPYYFDNPVGTGRQQAKNICLKVGADFDEHNLVHINIDKNRRVQTAYLTPLIDYSKTAPKEKFELLKKLADEYRQRKIKISFFNSTAAGGGVALMRHALIRLYRLLGIDADWYVMRAKQEIFDITKKKFHNILQDVAAPDVTLQPADKRLFNEWSEVNARFFRKTIKASNVIIIDDPQPSGMIPHIKKINPGAKIIYRSHIQVRAELIDKNAPKQRAVWNFIWKNAQRSDLFVSHPIKEFIPAAVPSHKVVLMPAATDRLDGLNKHLTEGQTNYYLELFNSILRKSGQTPLEPNRTYIIQIARFDPSKGIPHVIEAYRKLYDRMKKSGTSRKKLPQLVIAGNGAIDDPEGAPLYAATMQMLTMDTYAHLAGDIKVARLPHYDQILNALLSKSAVVWQLSLKEGFEVKVSEALNKGKPVIAYRTGGIPLQIKHGITGYLVKPGNTGRVAGLTHELLHDKIRYTAMNANARRLVNTDYFTVSNAVNWLWLGVKLMYDQQFRGNSRHIKKIIESDNENSL